MEARVGGFTILFARMSPLVDFEKNLWNIFELGKRIGRLAQFAGRRSRKRCNFNLLAEPPFKVFRKRNEVAVAGNKKNNVNHGRRAYRVDGNSHVPVPFLDAT